MNFPSFGDAETYAQLGRACADAIAGPGRVFDGCYHPIRPVGSALLMAVPYLATDDPVDAAYVALGLNVVLFAGVVACLAKALIGDRALLEGRPRRADILGAASFAVLLPNLVAHIPIRLADLPPLALLMAALLVAVRTAAGSWNGRPLLRRYLIAGGLCAARRAPEGDLPRLRARPAGLAAGPGPQRPRRAPALRGGVRGRDGAGGGPGPERLPHTGQLGLYDREFMRTFFTYPRREYGIESVIFTIPERSVYLTQVAGEISRLEVVVLRLFRGLFGFEWAVYLGEPSRGPSGPSGWRSACALGSSCSATSRSPAGRRGEARRACG